MRDATRPNVPDVTSENVPNMTSERVRDASRQNVRDASRQMMPGLLVAVYPAMVFAAAAGWQLVFALLALASFGVEEILRTRAQVVYGLLAMAGFGWTLRSLLRSLAMVVVIAVATGSVAYTMIIAASMLLIEGVRATKHLMASLMKASRTMPVLTRNIDLGALKIPDLPAGLVDRVDPRQVTYLGVLPAVGLAVGALTGSRYPVVAGAGLGALLAAGASVISLRHGLQARRMPTSGRINSVVRKQITAYAPEVIVYLSGTPTSAYQVNMWLDVAEHLDRRVLIMLRERAILAGLAPTDASGRLHTDVDRCDRFRPAVAAGGVLRRERRKEHPPAAAARRAARVHRPRRQRQGREHQPVLQGL